MPEISRLNVNSDWINLDFVERERTPEQAMKLGIQMHVAGLSLSNTTSVLESMGVKRSRKAVHDWVHKADLQPDKGRSPDHVVPRTMFAEPANLRFACDRRDCDPDKRQTVLAVRSSQPTEQQSASRTVVPLYYYCRYRNVSP